MTRPDGWDRRLSPLGDSRERAVPCARCRTLTIALEPLCDRCHEASVERQAERDVVAGYVDDARWASLGGAQ